jgi:putative transposase
MLCKIAGVSKSGYYKWLKRQDNPTDKDLDDQSIVTKIIECQQDPDINWSYGYPRVQTWLKKTYGLKVNHKRIYRLMKANEFKRGYGKRSGSTLDEKKNMSFQRTI